MAKEKEKINVVRVTLSTGKKVTLREIEIRDEETALRATAARAGENTMLAAKLMQDEMLRMLILEIDGKLDRKQLESLDSCFKYSEMQELRKVFKKLSGGEVADPFVELGSASGDN